MAVGGALGCDIRVTKGTSDGGFLVGTTLFVGILLGLLVGTIVGIADGVLDRWTVGEI